VLGILLKGSFFGETAILPELRRGLLLHVVAEASCLWLSHADFSFHLDLHVSSFNAINKPFLHSNPFRSVPFRFAHFHRLGWVRFKLID
jgi:hypothetical protein